MTRILVSVVHSWRFAEQDGTTAVTLGRDSRRHQLAALVDGGPPADDFALPWPPFLSNYWRYTLGRPNYRATPVDVLGRALVPLRALLRLTVADRLVVTKPLAEVFVLPFGLWTSLTIEVTGQWEDETAIADDLATVMNLSVTRSGAEIGKVKDGIDAGVAGDVLTVPWGDVPILDRADPIVLTSGLCPRSSAETWAPQYRSQFLGGSGGTVHPFTKTDGASATTSGQIGLALGDTSSTAPQRVKCLHHNHALLAGHLLSLGALVSSPTNAHVDAYRGWAARYLNHLYRGEPLQSAGIYKTRVAKAWLEQRRQLGNIDAVTGLLPRDPLPALVKPAN